MRNRSPAGAPQATADDGDPSAGGARRIHDRSFSERVVAAVAVPRVGAVVLVVAAVAFAILALLAAFDEGALLAIDEPIQRWVVDHRAAWLDDVMRAVTFLGSRYAVGALVLDVAIWTFRADKCPGHALDPARGVLAQPPSSSSRSKS